MLSELERRSLRSIEREEAARDPQFASALVDGFAGCEATSTDLEEPPRERSRFAALRHPLRWWRR